MPYMISTPDALAATAANIAEIGSRLSAASAAATVSTTRVTPAAADEVSAAIATLFGSYGHEYRALIAQAAAFHAQFERAMTAGAALYANAEAAHASRLPRFFTGVGVRLSVAAIG